MHSASLRRYVAPDRRERRLQAGAAIDDQGFGLVKERCEKHEAERDLFVEAHFLRKAGQSGVNPVTGETTTGQYESWTRFEIRDPALGRK